MQRLEKTVSEIVLDRAVPTMLPSQTVAAAVDVMREQQCDGVVVMRGGALVGIFTGRDFLERVAAETRDPEATLLADVMTTTPESLRAVDCISYAINRMGVRGYRNLPIVDDGGRPIALMSAHDVIEHLTDVLAELVVAPDENGPAAKWLDIGGGG